MIKVGDYKIEVKHFPDGTQCLMDIDFNKIAINPSYASITWNYESDEELVTLIYLVNYIRNKAPKYPIYLFMPYIPNARMDRTKNPGEVFTLKYFANIINGLHFDCVNVLDPHSDVSVALLNNVIVINPDDYLNTGVDISACPPGKHLKSINTLSGGENTLTAISLLFSILNIRKIPFVILDEVEAALDENNVDTFCTYLKNYENHTQFIVITHKKRTMEYANNLYGITMQESGVSKLVSVKLENI